jgi:hypothetical protein
MIGCRRMRRLALAKVAALMLLALILLPFTAPFKTYAFSATRSQHSDDQLVNDKLGDDEKLVESSERWHAPRALNVLVSPPILRDQVQQPQLHSTVLRI